MLKALKGLSPLIIFIGFIAFLAFGLSRDPAKLDSILIDQPFPDFSLTTLDNPDAQVTHEILNGQISLVNVFGSWCVACVQEHPNLMQIDQTGRVQMIGINWRDDRDKGRKWLNRYGDPYDVILFDGDSQMAVDLGVTGAPETFIVDQAGRIRYKHIGIVTADDWRNTILPLINRLETEA